MNIKYILFIYLVLFNNILIAQRFELVGLPGVKGNVQEILISPYESNVVYSVTDNGFYKSTDGGYSTIPVQFKDNGYDISDIALLDIGTLIIGEFNTGYYYSNDDGKTWSGINLDDEHYEKVIKLNPHNHDIIYIKKSFNELWNSNDRGKSWNLIEIFNNDIQTFSIHPQDTTIIYLITSNQLLKSSNSGKNWKGITELINATQLHINPLDTNVLYINDDNYLYKTVNGGKDFTQIFSDRIESCVLDPIDTNIILVANQLEIVDSLGGIYKSNDGGKNWVRKMNGIDSLYIDFVIPPFTHYFASALAINPQNRNEIFIGGINEKGIFKTDNGGENWYLTSLALTEVTNLCINNSCQNFLIASNLSWEILKKNENNNGWIYPKFDIKPMIINTILNSFDINPKNLLIGFLASESGLYKTLDGGVNWISQNYFDIETYNVYYHQYFPDTLFLNAYLSNHISYDGGISWYQYSKGFPSPYMKLTNTTPTIAYDNRNGRIYKSDDLGVTWKNISEGLIKSSESGNFLPISSLAPNVKQPNIVYCGQKGGISKSTNGGQTWNRVDSTLLDFEPEINRPSILLDENNPNRVYVGLLGYTDAYSFESTTGGLFLTEDDCKTWHKIYTSEVSDLFTDEGNPRYIYMNTNHGLLRFLDTLRITNINQKVQISIHKFKLMQNYPNPFNSSTNIKYSIPTQSKLILKLFDVLGREVATLVNKEQQQGNYEINFDPSTYGIKLNSGIYFYQLQSGDFIETKKMILLK